MAGARPGRAHNARDGRCRYTLGAERCPAPGSVRVGRWWVCAAHREWAQAPGDPLFAESGRQALRRQRAAHQLEARGATNEPEAGGAPARGDREQAMREIAAILGARDGS